MKLNFSLTQLEYVLAVHKIGHFAKAADYCNISQPTLSMQISKFEESIGGVIFDRSKKPILLTDLGESIISQIQTVVSEARKVETLISMKRQGGIKGTLDLGVIPTIAPYILPRLLPQLVSHYHGLDLRIREMQTHQIVQALHMDEIDVGLLAIPLREPQIIEQFLYFEPFSVLCAKSHPHFFGQKKVKYSSLKAEDIWLLEEGHCLRNQVLDVCTLKKDKIDKRKFKFESGSLETLKKLIDSYGGYTLLPWLAQDQIGENSLLIDFERPIPAREVGLVHRREHYKLELIKALHQALKASLPATLRQLRQKDLDVLPI